MFEALAHFVVGGMVALTARDNECAVVFPRTDERSGPNRAPPHPQAALSEVRASAPFSSRWRRVRAAAPARPPAHQWSRAHCPPSPGRRCRSGARRRCSWRATTRGPARPGQRGGAACPFQKTYIFGGRGRLQEESSLKSFTGRIRKTEGSGASAMDAYTQTGQEHKPAQRRARPRPKPNPFARRTCAAGLTGPCQIDRVRLVPSCWPIRRNETQMSGEPR